MENSNLPRNALNIVLAAKGGVGKSAVAAALAEAEIRRAMREAGLSTDAQVISAFAKFVSSVAVQNLDPENNTIGQYPSLCVEDLELLVRAESGELTQDRNKLDSWVDRVIAEPRPIVLDVGASAFRALVSHFEAYKVPEMLIAAGKPVVFHLVIAGGQHLPDTLQSAMTVSDSVIKDSGASVIVWANRFYGETSFQMSGSEIVATPGGSNAGLLLHNVIGEITLARPSDSDSRKLEEFVFGPRHLLADVYNDKTAGMVVKVTAKNHYGRIFEQLAKLGW